MPNITRWISAGLHCVQVAARDASGFMAGFGALTVADNEGDSSNMALLVGAVSAPSPLPGVNRTYNRGEDGYTGSWIFDAQPNELAIGFESILADLIAFLNHDTVMTEGEWDFVSEGGAIDFRDTMWLFTRRAQSKEADSDNAPGYENLLVMSVGGRFEAGNMEFQAAGAANVQAVASPVQKTHKGTTALASFGKATIYTERWFSEFPCSMAVLIGDGTETDIQLGFTPISVDKTKVYRFDTGAALTVNSVNTGTDVAVLSAAAPDAVACPCVYETTDL